MVAIRTAPRTATTLGARCPPAQLGRGHARTITSTASKIPPSRPADLSDLDGSALAAPPPDSSAIKAWQDGQLRARGDKFELPHSRYQYHPPQYDRGPLHPVQSPPSSDPTARNFVPGPFNLPRMRQTYESTMAHDILTLAYKHLAPGEKEYRPPPQLREWDGTSPYHKNRPPRGPRGSKSLWPVERDITWQNVPELLSVHVHAHTPKANTDRDYLWTARAAVQAVTGAVPEMFKTKHAVSQWGTREGKLAGVKATIEGDRAYEFLDKCLNLVLPRIKDWPGLKGTTGDGTGNLAFGLTGSEFALFPEIQVNYDMYPVRLIPGVDIFVGTSAKSDRQARLLLKAMGFPFFGKLVD